MNLFKKAKAALVFSTLALITLTANSSFAADKVKISNSLTNEEIQAIAVQSAYGFRELTEMLSKTKLTKAQAELYIKVITEVLVNAKEPLNKEKLQEVILAVQKKMSAQLQLDVQAEATKNLEDGKKYLAAFAKKKGVKIDKNTGIAYRIVKTGKGAFVKETDKVEINYVGKFADGTIFDKSTTPVTFAANQVITGFKATLMLMNPGAKIEVVIPAEHAYGENGVEGAIPPNSTLFFEIELIKINPPEKK